MEETKIVEDAMQEIKNSDETQLKEVIEKWFEATRTDGMRLGAYYISMGVYAAIQKNLSKAGKTSLRDYKRAIDDIIKIVAVQLKTEQNDSEEEVTDDGAAKESSESNS